MANEQREEIRRRLDEDLSLEAFQNSPRSTDEAATQFFQDLFTQVLNFEMSVSPTGQDTWHELPAHRWRDSARANAARLFAEAGNFRVVYVELESLTRSAERNAIQSITRSDRRDGWALEGSFLTVFHAPDEEIWHLVTPYEEDTDLSTGRPVLRRYTLGEGETHRTVADALSRMDASEGRLAERIDDAFDVKPVTEDFYEGYKEVFEKLSDELRDEGLDIEDADRYAHVTLNRLMFFYFLQKKGWIGDRKDFVRWFYEQYERSDDEGQFHEKWLSALFFDGMNYPAGEPVDRDLPDEVRDQISGLAHMNGGLFQSMELDQNDVYLSDAAFNNVIRGFLEKYNFTITEESPYDIDVAVDPAMLGKIYESLIAEQERGKSGIFYTPRREVDLMCRLAIYDQIRNGCSSLGEETRLQIVDFVFTEPESWESSGEDLGEIESLLQDLEIVDPACGSGAFLVGMKQVLLELYRKLDVSIDYDFQEQIVNENLYGVDIKDWAVRVAEFRLWLSLVEGEEQLPDKRPVLPNFSFKLRDGDSIVTTIGDESLTFGEIERSATGEVYQQLQQVQELKSEYFYGESDIDEDSVRTEQRELLLKYIESRIENLKPYTKTQQKITGGETDESKKEAAEAETEISRLENIQEHIEAGDQFFMWELDFPEVMFSGGFDVVISNPPYVRRERLVPQSIPGEIVNGMTKNERTNRADKYVDGLSDYVGRRFNTDLSRWSDLYVYFFFRGFDLLEEGGSLVYVTSNSWLGVNFGDELREYLLEELDLRYVFHNDVQRTFEEADVNTAITVVNNRIRGDSTTQFTSFQEPYEEAIQFKTMADFLEERENSGDPFKFQYHSSRRERVLPRTTLWKEGGGEISDNSENPTTQLRGSYSGDKWMKYLRAPDIYFDIDRREDIFTTLDELGDVNTALLTGANPFFILPQPGDENRNWSAEMIESTGNLRLTSKEGNKEIDIESEYWMHPLSEEGVERGKTGDASQWGHTYENGTGEIYVPNHILKSTRNRNHIETSPEESDGILFRAGNIGKDELKPGGLEYINWGKDYEPSRGGPFPDRDNTGDNLWNGGSAWYNVEERSGSKRRNISECVGDLVWPRAFFKRLFVIRPSLGRLLSTDSFYAVQLHDQDHADRICAQLNSTLWLFIIEIKGRVNLGEGALTNMSSEVDSFPIIEPDRMIWDAEIQNTYKEFVTRGVGTIFEELGATSPERVSFETVKDDRRQLDSRIMGDLLGLTEEEQLTVYRGLLDLINNRVEKSESV